MFPKEEQMESASLDGQTELIPEEALQVKASFATLSSITPTDSVSQLWSPQSSKAHKSDHYQTPSRSSSEYFWSSPFADPPAQYYTEPDKEKQPESPTVKFSGARQPSLQDWCDGSVEITAKRSRSALTQAQSLKLTPHGSPKLSLPGLPIFPPGAPKKPARRSMGDRPLSNLISSDSASISDLLSCDEDLGLSWSAVRG